MRTWVVLGLVPLFFVTSARADTPTLRCALESASSVGAPSVGPGGRTSAVYWGPGRVGNGATMSPDVRRYVSFPLSAINLEAGNLEVWFRSNTNPASDSTRRVIFAVGRTGVAPVMVLEESDRLRFRVQTAAGTFEAVGAVNAAVWPQWSWVRIRAEWDARNMQDSLRVFVNGTRVASMTQVAGGWSASGVDPAVRFTLGGLDENGAAQSSGIFDELLVQIPDIVGGDAGVAADSGAAPDAGVAPDAGFFADASFPDASAPDASAPDAGGGGGYDSPGCGPTNGAPGVYNEAIYVNGQRRTYVLVVPNGYWSTNPVALTFGWHGNYWLGSSFRNSTDIETHAAGASIFVYPDGLQVPSGGTGWISDPNGRDIAFFDALYNSLLQRFCVDTRHVFSFGFSMGANFTNALGCHRGNRLAAIAAAAGWGPSGGCTASTSAWIYHNTGDTTVSYSSGVASRDYWRSANACNSVTVPSSPPTCVEYRTCAPGRSVGWCSQTGGHTPHSWTGQAMWRFFQTKW